MRDTTSLEVKERGQAEIFGYGEGPEGSLAYIEGEDWPSEIKEE